MPRIIVSDKYESNVREALLRLEENWLVDADDTVFCFQQEDGISIEFHYDYSIKKFLYKIDGSMKKQLADAPYSISVRALYVISQYLTSLSEDIDILREIISK